MMVRHTGEISQEEMVGIILRHLRPGGEVLDVGCGSGRTLELLAEKGVKGLGVDPWPGSTGVPCLRMRAEEIGSLGRRFVLVYTIHSLHHFSDPRAFIRQARLVLEPGGILLIVDWVRGAKTGVRERYFSPRRSGDGYGKVAFPSWRREGGGNPCSSLPRPPEI